MELYYTVQQTSLLLALCDKTVIQKLKAGDLGRDVVNLGSMVRPDYRIPASGINSYLDGHRVFSFLNPVAARTEGELRRKAA